MQLLVKYCAGLLRKETLCQVFLQGGLTLLINKSPQTFLRMQQLAKYRAGLLRKKTLCQVLPQGDLTLLMNKSLQTFLRMQQLAKYRAGLLRKKVWRLSCIKTFKSPSEDLKERGNFISIK
jgi:hypothetical protein